MMSLCEQHMLDISYVMCAGLMILGYSSNAWDPESGRTLDLFSDCLRPDSTERPQSRTTLSPHRTVLWLFVHHCTYLTPLRHCVVHRIHQPDVYLVPHLLQWQHDAPNAPDWHLHAQLNVT